MKWSQVTQATELFLALFAEGKITHDGNPRWLEALNVARFREGNSNGRALTKKEGVVCELIAATFAVWGLENFGSDDVKPEVKKIRRYVGKAKPVARRAGVSAMSF